MGIEDAVMAAEFLQARMYVPMHFKTFEVIDVEPGEFVQRVQAKGQQARVVPVGESLDY
jgi:L-ascorbate metabolism protein UlaG (beta-lactamase superfamily)